MAAHKIPEQIVAAPMCTAAAAPKRVRCTPGYYAIFIDDPCALPMPFQNLLVQRQTKVIYIGIATRIALQAPRRTRLATPTPIDFFPWARSNSRLSTTHWIPGRRGESEQLQIQRNRYRCDQNVGSRAHVC